MAARFVRRLAGALLCTAALSLSSSCSSLGMKDSAASVLSLPLRMLGSVMGMFSASAGASSSDEY